VNVAILPSAFHPSLGGVEELSRQLALELRNQGHGVIVVTNQWPRTLPEFEDIDGLPVYRLPFRWPGSGLKSEISYRLTRRRVESRLRELLRRNAVDVLHVQCVSSNGLYALGAQQRLNLPLVVTLQGELTMDAGRLFQTVPFAQSVLRRCMAEADVVTGCSGMTLGDGEAFFGQKLGDRGRVVFNAAQVADFGRVTPLANPRPYLFALGRLVPQKGFDVLLRAFADTGLAATHDLLLAGDGPDREALQALIGELKLDGVARLVGRADRPQVAAYFKGAELFVLPSTADEGLPVVTAEAMAAGKAVVATRSGGAPEAVLHEQTGLIVEKGDRAGLAAAIRRVVGDPALRQRLADAGLARAPLFGWPEITRQYVACYEAARQARPSGAVLAAATRNALATVGN
jgi:glycogen synthase